MSVGDRAPGANVRTQEGNNPDRQLRSQTMAKWETKWEGTDSKEVGLEAAILYRKRNSSLIESSCAEDVTRLSHRPKQRMRVRRGARGWRSVCNDVQVAREGW